MNPQGNVCNLTTINEVIQTEKPKEPKRLNPNIKIILVCTILLVLTLSISMYFMFKHLNELSKSPFVYGATQTSKLNNNSEVFCSCSVNNKEFYFNQTGLYNHISSFNIN